MSENDEAVKARRDLEREVLINRMLLLAERPGSLARVKELGEYLRMFLVGDPERNAVAYRIYQWKKQDGTVETPVYEYLEFLGEHIRWFYVARCIS